MKKTIKKIIALIMVSAMAFSLMACGDQMSEEEKEKQEDYASRIEVKANFWRSGLGEEYIKQIIDAFNESQTEYYVTYTSSSSQAALTGAYGLESVDDTDLYIGCAGTREYLEPLEDLLDVTIEGESKPLRDKFLSYYLENTTASDGHIYGLTIGGGNLGIVYNKALFESVGIEKTPRTTDELIKVCEQLKENNITPFIHFTGGGYWEYYIPVWQAQYDGYDYWKNNWSMCTDVNGNSPSKEVFTTKDGRYQTLKVLEKLLVADNIESGSNSLDHISAQTTLLNKDIGMMVTGSWISHEMEGLGTIDNYAIMKNPVISSIIDKLTTVNNDLQLRDLIDAIDAVTDGKASIDDYRSGDNYIVAGAEISAEDWDYVMSARNMIQGGAGGGLSIVKYSQQKEGAKAFVQFFYSDEAYKIFAKCTKMCYEMKLSTGEELDTSEWNSFEKEQYDRMQNAQYLIGDAASRHEIFVNGGASAYATVNFIIPYTSRNQSQSKTADEMWQMVMEKVDLYYDGWVQNIE